MSREIIEELVKIPAASATLEGFLELPEGTKAIVVFAHGSGSSRHSKRNRYVAGVLHEAGIGTLLFDLLSPEEDMAYENRFNIGLLAERLRAATNWLRDKPKTGNLVTGYFGSSTGAAAALTAAAGEENKIAAIVSRGGRPDLAPDALPKVQSPTLLIVGGLDDVVIVLNKQAYALLTCEKEMRIVPGATHLFEEQGKLQEVAGLAAEWFSRFLLRAK